MVLYGLNIPVAHISLAPIQITKLSGTFIVDIWVYQLPIRVFCLFPNLIAITVTSGDRPTFLVSRGQEVAMNNV